MLNDSLILEHLPPAKWWRPARWRVVRPIYYPELGAVVSTSGRRYRINAAVPADFITDGASIPRPFWPLFSPTGKHMRAAVLHDYLYHQLHSNHDDKVRKAQRRDYDKLFYLAMLDSGVARWRAKLMYWAVRVFGWL